MENGNVSDAGVKSSSQEFIKPFWQAPVKVYKGWRSTGIAATTASVTHWLKLMSEPCGDKKYGHKSCSNKQMEQGRQRRVDYNCTACTAEEYSSWSALVSASFVHQDPWSSLKEWTPPLQHTLEYRKGKRPRRALWHRSKRQLIAELCVVVFNPFRRQSRRPRRKQPELPKQGHKDAVRQTSGKIWFVYRNKCALASFVCP